MVWKVPEKWWSKGISILYAFCQVFGDPSRLKKKKEQYEEELTICFLMVLKASHCIVSQ